MRAARIGVDCDGVLADWNAGFVPLLIKVTGRDLFPACPFRIEDISTWNYPESFGYTKAEVSKAWTAIKQDPHFWRSLPEYPDARVALDQLSLHQRVLGNDVYFITSRVGIGAKQQTETWIKGRWFSGNPTVLISSHKGLCARALQLDFYIDDKWENALDVATTETSSFLLTRPWNVEFDAGAQGIHRVDSLAQFFDAMEGVGAGAAKTAA